MEENRQRVARSYEGMYGTADQASLVRSHRRVRGLAPADRISSRSRGSRAAEPRRWGDTLDTGRVLCGRVPSMLAVRPLVGRAVVLHGSSAIETDAGAGRVVLSPA